MLKVYVVGCGGIGTYIIDLLPKTIASLSVDFCAKCVQGYTEARVLRDAGRIALPCIVDRLTLIDGDVFDVKNMLRQCAGAGTKVFVQQARVHREKLKGAKASARVAALLDILDDPEEIAEVRDAASWLLHENRVTGRMLKEMRESLLMSTYLQRMEVVGYNSYVAPECVADLIPANPPGNPLNKIPDTDWYRVPEHVKNTTVVFLGLDNIKSRKEIFDYLKTLDNVVCINGGNDKTTGQINFYERRDGVDLDPTLIEIYKPEITDKRPDELACTTVAAARQEQVALTNRMIADWMLQEFVTWVDTGRPHTAAQKTVGGNVVRAKRYNEILVDTNEATLNKVSHICKEVNQVV